VCEAAPAAAQKMEKSQRWPARRQEDGGSGSACRAPSFCPGSWLAPPAPLRASAANEGRGSKAAAASGPAALGEAKIPGGNEAVA